MKYQCIYHISGRGVPSSSFRDKSNFRNFRRSILAHLDQSQCKLLFFFHFQLEISVINFC